MLNNCPFIGTTPANPGVVKNVRTVATAFLFAGMVVVWGSVSGVLAAQPLPEANSQPPAMQDGLTALSPLDPVPLVDFGATWNYLDDGSDQSVLWHELIYDDSAWASGPAPLGYGDGDENTVVGFGPDADKKFLTTYFRRTFEIRNASAYTNLLLRLLRDDGGVVYLNNVEVLRANMPVGEILHTTPAEQVIFGAAEREPVQAVLDPAVLVDGTNLLAVEIHQANETSSDISFDLALIGNFIPEPPSVALTSPTNEALLKATEVSLKATATDSDGSVSRVVFYVNNIQQGIVTSPPYDLTWTNVAPGTYTLTAVAVDNYNLAATSAPVAITVKAPPPAFIRPGAVWAYLDDGTDQGEIWREPGFDDSTWQAGRAELGFGEGDEATVVASGPTTDRIPTYYFRHTFSVGEISAHTNMVLRLLRDDGAVVYLNGTEVYRSNLPEGPINFRTRALVAAESKVWYATPVSMSLLRSGNNLLAVEIHQVNSTSSDISFDLELLPDVPPKPPDVRLTSPAAGATFEETDRIMVQAQATDDDDPVARVEFYAAGTLMDLDDQEPYNGVLTNLAPGSYDLYAVATDNSGLAQTSAPVRIEVISGPVVETWIAPGAVWKFLDDGTEPANWMMPSFDDSTWSSGPGILGFGSLGRSGNTISPNTGIESGPFGARTVTHYFRHRFIVDNANDVTNLSFRILRDDGVVVYLNGEEVLRMNMDDGPVASDTLAASPVGGSDESTYFPAEVSPTYLRSGANVLAVELHQSTLTTSDAGFDLELAGISPSSPFPPRPRLSIERMGNDLVISWEADGSVLQEADKPDGPFQDVQPAATGGSFTIPTLTGKKFYGLRAGP